MSYACLTFYYLSSSIRLSEIVNHVARYISRLVSKFFLCGLDLEMIGKNAHLWVNAVRSVTGFRSGVLLFLDAKLVGTCDLTAAQGGLFCYDKVMASFSCCCTGQQFHEPTSQGEDGLKIQAIEAPNGLCVSLSRLFIGSFHDASVFAQSGVAQLLAGMWEWGRNNDIAETGGRLGLSAVAGLFFALCYFFLLLALD